MADYFGFTAYFYGFTLTIIDSNIISREFNKTFIDSNIFSREHNIFSHESNENNIGSILFSTSIIFILLRQYFSPRI